MEIILVFLGGAFGAFLRFVFINLSNFLDTYQSIFFINFIGCLFFGSIVGLSFKDKKHLEKRIKLFFTTGVAGGFTTFSTFSYDCFLLLQSHKYFLFLLYSTGSVVLSIFAFYSGLYFSEFIQNGKSLKKQ